MKLPSGSYQFQFRLKCSDNTRPEALAVLEVRAVRDGREVILASREVKATDFPRAGEWHVFTLKADVEEGDDLTVSVRFRPGVSDLWCDWVRIQPLGPVGDRMLDLSPEFWRDTLYEPVRVFRPLGLGSLELRGTGSPLRPLRLVPRGSVELGPAGGFRLRLGRGEAIISGPEGEGHLSLEFPGARRLVIDSSSARFERYDRSSGAWVEQMTADLVESWRDEDRPDKIAMRALRNYPLGPSDLEVPGLDEAGRLVLTEVAARAPSLDLLAEERAWAGELLDLVSEREAALEAHRSDPNAHHEAFVKEDVYADFASKRLLTDVADYDGRLLTDLVKASEELGRDGTIRPGAISVSKIASNVGVKSDLITARASDIYSTELTNYIEVERFYLSCQSAVKNVIEAASCELRVLHGDGQGKAWCKITVQEGDGPEELYAEWSTTSTDYEAFSAEDEVMGDEGQPFTARFYIKVEVIEAPPPGGELPKAYMRNPCVRGRRYALRLEVP